MYKRNMCKYCLFVGHKTKEYRFEVPWPVAHRILSNAHFSFYIGISIFWRAYLTSKNFLRTLIISPLSATAFKV